MSASNRAARLGKLQKALKKHYKPNPVGASRPLLEHVLYASLLQDAPYDLADEGMAKCEQEFFDWNEVRVTSLTELTQVLSRLPEPAKAASRLKSNLQAIFEEFYTFDLDHMKKENLGRAVAKFEKMPGMTPFVLNYTVQHGLSGHAVPIDYSAMVIMLVTEIASQPEANSGKVPGVERAIPKNKGIEFADLLHQCAVALNKSPKDKTARAVLEAVEKGSGKRLDEWLATKKAAKRRVVKRKEKERADAIEAAKEAAAAPPEKTKKKAARKAPVKKAAPPAAAAATPTEEAPAAKKKANKKASEPAKEAAAVKKKSPAKSDTANKEPVKKAPVKKAPTKKAAPKASKKTTKAKATPAKTTKKASTAASSSKATKKKASKKSDNRKLTKRKPR